MLVIFRGRNTAGIVSDAAAYFGDDVAPTIVCLDDDELMQPDDVPVSALEEKFRGADVIVVIANGGPTTLLLSAINAKPEDAEMKLVELLPGGWPGVVATLL